MKLYHQTARIFISLKLGILAGLGPLEILTLWWQNFKLNYVLILDLSNEIYWQFKSFGSLELWFLSKNCLDWNSHYIQNYTNFGGDVRPQNGNFLAFITVTSRIEIEKSGKQTINFSSPVYCHCTVGRLWSTDPPP